MKKLISILLSLSFLFSITTGIDFYANAEAGADNERLYSSIAKRVMGYNTNFGYDYTAVFGAENDSKNYNACTYDVYVLPLAELGIQEGDTLIFTNSHGNKDFLYNSIFLNDNWKYVSSSNWVWKNIDRTIAVSEEMQYLTFCVTYCYGESVPFDKADIPFEDFKIYKNSVSTDNAINYLSLWREMIEFDDNTELPYEFWCHNMDFDYQNEHSYTGKTMQENLEFFDGFDIDLKTTSDGVKVCWYNNKNYNVPEHTYAELKETYPQVMTYEDMLEYIQDNGKKLFVLPFGETEARLAEQYGVQDRVFRGTESNSQPISSPSGNLYLFCQTSAVYNIDLYKENNARNNHFYVNTDTYFSGKFGGSFFTDEQINELAENGINIGLSFCMQHRIMEFIKFCRTHDESVFDKINHFVIENENSLECLKAAMRYVYGICRHTETEIKNAKPATCTEIGYSGDVYCKNCGEQIEKGETLSITAHTYTTERIVTKATEKADGKIETQEKCADCGYVKSSTTAKIPKVSTIELQKTTIGYNWYYTGKQITPTIIVKDSTGKALVRGTDYSLTYDSGRVNIGKYAIKVTFKGNYSGTKTLEFNIVQKPAKDQWLKSGNRWWYRHADGSYTKNGWEKISGKWYHFDKSGWMQTGWLKLSGKWYYLNSSGAMATGWTKVSNKWYYMNGSGVMQTGWIKLSNKWYYLNSSGAMLTGRQKIGNKWYTFNSSGVWIK